MFLTFRIDARELRVGRKMVKVKGSVWIESRNVSISKKREKIQRDPNGWNMEIVWNFPIFDTLPYTLIEYLRQICVV